MTREHLTRVLGSLVTQEEIDNLYEPAYSKIEISEDLINNEFKKLLTFDYKNHNMNFMKAEITAAGIQIKFKTARFQEVSVTVFYDYMTKKIFNHVLAIPKYTEYDGSGTKTIRQSSNKVVSDKCITKYFNRLYKRFECPVLN